MEQIRRLDNNKRQKLSLTTKFVNLSTELLFEIFEYLYFHESLYLNKIQCNAIEIILNSLKSIPMLTSLATKPNNLLSYIPNIRQLSLKNIDRRNTIRKHNQTIILNNLTHVSFKLYSIHFNVFELLVKDFFRLVQVLCLTSLYYGFVENQEYLDANLWEQLILNYLSNLL
ncbi:unnamed protein product [Adineta steineri]|uniref:F-box domain-containing protein n=1 Tax=Adineta steineri TaxID=433720 RepID=A0A815J5V2_9BILA|nr:unnamed protein product [Adineta steineri]CAF3810134.1 unnamed protein product [Adineta steineri]